MIPPFAVLAAALSLPAFIASTGLRAQTDPAPGTPDESFVIDRVRNNNFIPSQTNFTPFVIAIQPGASPVQPAFPNQREIPAGRSKLLIGGDGGTLYRTFLTRTVRSSTSYDADGVPVTTFGQPFEAGDIDQAFFTSPGSDNGFGVGGRITYSLSVNNDGSLLVGGIFGESTNEDSVFEGTQKNFILLTYSGDAEVALNGAGEFIEGPFNANVDDGANDAVLAILRRSTLAPGETEGRILLGGQFTEFNDDDRGRLVQLLPDGRQDEAFNSNLGDGASSIVFSLAETVGPGLDAFGQPFFGTNGQVYVCGDFDEFNGEGPGKLIRLNVDGTRDFSFTADVRGRAIAVAVQPDGKVLVGGDLRTVNNDEAINVARVNYDGTSDLVFNANAQASLASPRNIPPPSVYVLKVQGDGRILVGGNYLRLNGEVRRYLGRLNADGTLDTTFDAGETLSQATQSVVFVPRDASFGNATDIIYSQTRADRKQVPGDEGFFPAPVRRLFGDNNSATVAAFPVGAPLVRVGADGPMVEVGDLSVQPDLPLQQVLNPGTPGLFRVTREGDTTNDLLVRLKIVGPAMANLNRTYGVRRLDFTFDAATGLVTPSVSDFFPGVRFDVVIPAGESRVDLLVEGRADGQAQFVAEPVTLKVKASADGSYSLRADQKSAVVTILPNNL